MKVIFLDIDGVLNSEDWYKKRFEEVDKALISSMHPFYEFDPLLVQNLNRIVKETGAKVVVSSTWRKKRSVEELQEILEKVGFEGEVIDKTPYFGGIGGFGYTVPRGCEIEWWVENQGYRRINWSKERLQEEMQKSKVKNYVILDDDSDMLFSQREHFVQTSWKSGLDASSVERAIRILKSSPEDLYYVSEKVS